MNGKELTIADVLADPLIRQVMRADGVSLKGMKSLLQMAARRQDCAQTTRRRVFKHRHR